MHSPLYAATLVLLATCSPFILAAPTEEMAMLRRGNAVSMPRPLPVMPPRPNLAPGTTPNTGSDPPQPNSCLQMRRPGMSGLDWQISILPPVKQFKSNPPRKAGSPEIPPAIFACSDPLRVNGTSQPETVVQASTGQPQATGMQYVDLERFFAGASFGWLLVLESPEPIAKVTISNLDGSISFPPDAVEELAQQALAAQNLTAQEIAAQLPAEKARFEQEITDKYMQQSFSGTPNATTVGVSFYTAQKAWIYVRVEWAGNVTSTVTMDVQKISNMAEAGQIIWPEYMVWDIAPELYGPDGIPEDNTPASPSDDLFVF